ncbi:hypothetical protein ACOBQB_10380 [Streptomyces sp. G5(2025)]|uniref:hypothetical protein n=1 Tax=Streptomyces sp. G5(2025) TaxID=3406628 RepID=UPI003C20D484
MAHVALDGPVGQTSGRTGQHEPRQNIGLEGIQLVRAWYGTSLTEILHDCQTQPATPHFDLAERRRMRMKQVQEF